MLADTLCWDKYHIYLASQSPRRRELLHAMDVPFEVLTTHVMETYPQNLSPIEVAMYLSQLKLSTIDFPNFPENSLFIACDTIVVLNDEIMGKPKNFDDAVAMLHKLSGKEHTVVSGVTVKTARSSETDYRTTQVKFRPLSDEEIRYSVEQYRPFDKAGAYGVQEWLGLVGIEYVKGSFYNVMGLPTQLLWQMLLRAKEALKN